MARYDLRSRRGIATISARLRRQLREQAEARWALLERAEETGERVEFPSRESLALGGGRVRDIRLVLSPEDVERIPDQYLPYLCDPAFDGSMFTGSEVSEILEPDIAAESKQRSDIEQALKEIARPAKRSGGRPRKDFWEDLLIDTAAAIYENDLKPKSTEDIARWMQDWLLEHGFDASESSLKQRARKITARFLTR